ncbi:ArsR family transcriptional regulator [Actinoplanes sp. NPDC048967]|uniref:arsenate reductase/protein-tyrosine-phosphatase family protein n=1 Tax=Actinoplanes sp. NPDC048967 TaxID=3155269 RepID=UPI0033EA18F5
MGAKSQDPPAFVRLAAHPLRWRLLSALAGSDHRVRELVELVGEPQNLVSYHLRLLRDGGLVTASRSSFDRRDSYYHLDLDCCAAALSGTAAALHPALRQQSPAELPTGGGVLFVCTGNSARSPIAEALLRHRTGGRIEVASAGIRPKAELHPDAVRVLRRDFGIDLGDRRPRHFDTLTGHRFDYVISVCDQAREACPEFAGRPRRMHWSIPDPATSGDPRHAFAHTAAALDTRIRHLLPTLTEGVQP